MPPGLVPITQPDTNLLDLSPPETKPEDLQDLIDSVSGIPDEQLTSVSPTEIGEDTSKRVDQINKEVLEELELTGEPPPGSTRLPLSDETKNKILSDFQENKNNMDDEKKKRYLDFYVTNIGGKVSQGEADQALFYEQIQGYGENTATGVKVVTDVAGLVIGVFVPANQVARVAFQNADKIKNMVEFTITGYNAYQDAIKSGATHEQASFNACGAVVSKKVFDAVKGALTGQVNKVGNKVLSMGKVTGSNLNATEKVTNGVMNAFTGTVAGLSNKGISAATDAANKAVDAAVKEQSLNAKFSGNTAPVSITPHSPPTGSVYNIPRS